MIINVITRAANEVLMAADTLNDARQGSGRRFEREYAATIRDIPKRPAFYPLVSDAPHGLEIREAYLPRYHYRIIFLVLPGEVIVLAVAHAARDPGYWHRRVPYDE